MAGSTLFVGEFEHSIDDKSRLAVPARFRGALENGLYITRGLDPCLVIWDEATWNAQAQDIGALNWWDNRSRRFQRRFFGGAIRAVPDKLGRIVIPRNLREYAQLDSDVVLVGLGDRCEIWSAAEWGREREEVERSGADIGEHLAARRYGTEPRAG